MENSQKLLKKIKAREIAQKPRLKYVLKNILFWTLFVFSIIIGGLSFSVILFVISENDFDLFLQITDSKIEFLFGILPFFWAISCAFFLIISIFGLRHTKTGYRHSLIGVFAGSIILSILLGSAFFFIGGAKKIENIFAENVPIYKSVEEKKIAVWSMPEQGFLSGIIIEKEIAENKKVIIQDFNGKQWEIDYTHALMRGRVLLQDGEKIKIRGKISENDIFIAEEIRPWEGTKTTKSRQFLNL